MKHDSVDEWLMRRIPFARAAAAVALFGGFTYRLAAMVWGTPPAGVKPGEGWDIGHVPLILTGLALVGLGMTLPDPIRTLLDQAVNILLAR